MAKNDDDSKVVMWLGLIFKPKAGIATTIIAVTGLILSIATYQHEETSEIPTITVHPKLANDRGHQVMGAGMLW
jgi:hypothetical protein